MRKIANILKVNLPSLFFAMKFVAILITGALALGADIGLLYLVEKLFSRISLLALRVSAWCLFIVLIEVPILWTIGILTQNAILSDFESEYDFM